MDFIERGKRLPQPEKCPDTVYKQMLRCWQAKPEHRPTFRELNQHFEEDPLYADARAIMRGRESWRLALIPSWCLMKELNFLHTCVCGRCLLWVCTCMLACINVHLILVAASHWLRQGKVFHRQLLFSDVKVSIWPLLYCVQLLCVNLLQWLWTINVKRQTVSSADEQLLNYNINIYFLGDITNVLQTHNP